ncbi:MAG: 4Fe-4S binding protein [Desulfobacterales bacterium]
MMGAFARICPHIIDIDRQKEAAHVFYQKCSDPRWWKKILKPCGRGFASGDMIYERKIPIKGGLPIGGVVADGGNSADYETGTWRTSRPVWYGENCINCLTCWIFCPEDAFVLKDGLTKSGKPRKEIDHINYYHCKGCGLCAQECPVNKRGKSGPGFCERTH